MKIEDGKPSENIVLRRSHTMVLKRNEKQDSGGGRLWSLTIGWTPILFSIGSLEIAWHGVMTVLAVVVGVLVPTRLARRLGQTSDQVYSIALWAVPGGLIGARLSHVFDSWGYYTAHPVEILYVWQGGVGLWGALIGGALTGVGYAYFRKLPVLKFCDIAAPGILLAQAVGRVGCLINGDAPGTKTSLPWALVYTNPNAQSTTFLFEARHPAAVDEMMWDLLVVAILWRFFGKFKHNGMLFFLYLSIYAVGRFMIEFVREDRVIAFGWLKQAHIISLVVLAVCVPWFIYLARKPMAAPAASAGETKPAGA